MSASASANQVSYKKDSMIRGFHVYHSVWKPFIGEELCCMRELSNSQEPFSVAVMKGSIVVGHMPRKISSICSMFICKGGSITCEVVALRHYSEDLPQDGLEIPCLMNFLGEHELVCKVERLMMTADKLIPDKSVELLPGKHKNLRAKLMITRAQKCLFGEA